MMYYARLFLSLLLGLFVLSACSDRTGNTQEELSGGAIDLLQQFHTQQQQATRVIDFRSDAEPEKYLLHGWAGPEKKFTWALKDRSNLLFYRYDTLNDVEVDVLGMAFPALDGAPQITEVFVNDLKVSTFTMDVDKLKTYRLTVPAKMLRCGPNVLEFRFSYSAKPIELNSEAHDSRRLSAAFYQITLSDSGNLVHTREATQAIDFRKGGVLVESVEFRLEQGWKRWPLGQLKNKPAGFLCLYKAVPGT